MHKIMGMIALLLFSTTTFASFSKDILICHTKNYASDIAIEFAIFTKKNDQTYHARMQTMRESSSEVVESVTKKDNNTIFSGHSFTLNIEKNAGIGHYTKKAKLSFISGFEIDMLCF